MTNASFSGGTALIQLDRGCENDDDHDSVYQIRCGQVILINYVICTATGSNAIRTKVARKSEPKI